MCVAICLSFLFRQLEMPPAASTASTASTLASTASTASQTGLNDLENWPYIRNFDQFWPNIRHISLYEIPFSSGPTKNWQCSRKDHISDDDVSGAQCTCLIAGTLFFVPKIQSFSTFLSCLVHFLDVWFPWNLRISSLFCFVWLFKHVSAISCCNKRKWMRLPVTSYISCSGNNGW